MYGSSPKVAGNYTYDANGNILTLDRTGKAGSISMDELSYHYYAGTNRLEYVDDAVASANYGIDIDDQSAGNYTYDAIGNLVSDVSEEIEEIEWTVYGKIASITRTASSTKPNLQFEYSPDGHRVAKHVINKNGITTSTWYVRDASGNIMATYSKDMYMELDTSNVFADSIIMMIKNTETTETYVDFMIEGLNMGQYLTTTHYETLRDHLNTQGTLEAALESVSPMHVLSANGTWAAAVLNNVSTTKLNEALLIQYGGDEVMYANTVFANGCYGVFRTDILSANYFNFAEYILAVSDPTDVQNLWDMYFFPTPYPGHVQAATDFYNNVGAGALYINLDDLNPGLLFQLYFDYAGTGALTTFFDSWASLNACARAELGDGMCLDYVDQLDRTYLWNEFQALYSLTDIADEMIAFAPDVFLRAGLLQHPEMALTLSEAGTYHLIPPSTMYPDYVFSVNDVFNGIENYYPFGSVYLQNVKNALMNSGHAAPGWTYSVAEHHIYGSSRLGVHNTNKLIASRDNQNPIVYTRTSSEYTTFTRGKRHYELSNHLGNVQVVISDKRVSVCDEYLGVDRFEAEVLSAMDYYPFGMLIPDRQWYANSDSSNYRFGFNGMERDNEVSGQGNNLDFGARIYDSRLGRWLSVDPWENRYPHLSVYNFAKNSCISQIDIAGNGAEVSIIPKTSKNPTPKIKVKSTIYVYGTTTQTMESATNLATDYQKELNKNWNNAGSNTSQSDAAKPIPAKVKIGETEYEVEFEVTVIAIKADEAKKLFSENKSKSANFIALTDNTAETKTSQSYGNVGIWNVDQIKNTSGTINDEFGHLLGFRPSSDMSGYEDNAEAYHRFLPKIEFADGEIICAMCRNSYGSVPANAERKPLQSDVDGLNNGKGLSKYVLPGSSYEIGDKNNSVFIQDSTSFEKSTREILENETKP